MYLLKFLTALYNIYHSKCSSGIIILRDARDVKINNNYARRFFLEEIKLYVRTHFFYFVPNIILVSSGVAGSRPTSLTIFTKFSIN